jgi:hypothetical protein
LEQFVADFAKWRSSLQLTTKTTGSSTILQNQKQICFKVHAYSTQIKWTQQHF